MEFSPIEREQKHVRVNLTIPQLQSICERAFGEGVVIKSVQELAGGTFNSTYLVTPEALSQAVLRIAPDRVEWDDVLLMRREYTIQPFFAPIAHLMPKILLADFTHQLIDRDYVFQSYIEGERWDDVQDQVTPAEDEALWRQFGSVLKSIHGTIGEAFGQPYPGTQFSTWSQTVINRFERIQAEVKKYNIESAALTKIIEGVRQKASLLDEIDRPRLLHGDLWLFNILIKRTAQGAKIVGVLDADRAWWGDPDADWTMFILANAPAIPEVTRRHSLLWQAYGQPEESDSRRFRMRVYEAMHAGTALLWATTHHDEGTIKRAHEKLGDIAAVLGV